MQSSSLSRKVGLHLSHITLTQTILAWKIAFQTTFHSFGDNFGDVVKNLERSKELLVQSASINQFREAQDTRIILIQGFEARMKHERLEQMTTTINWLSSISWNDEHEKIQEKRLEFPGTARWVFDTAPFCDWLRSYESCSPVFWLYGIPGAGNDVPCASSTTLTLISHF